MVFVFKQSNFPALQNAITGFTKNENRKYELLETQASSNILPPQINTNALDPTLIPSSEEFPQFDKTNERRNAFSDESDELRGMLPPPTGFEPPKLLPTYSQEFRAREEARLRQLGLPIQSITATSRTPLPRVAVTPRPVAQQIAQQPQTVAKPATKTFDPDKNFKAFEHILQPGKKATHKDYDFSRYFTKKPGTPTNAPAPRRQNRPVQNANRRVASPVTARPFVQFSTTTKKLVASTQRPFVTTKPVPVVTTTTTRRTTQAPTTKAPITQVPRAQPFNAFGQNQFNRPAAVVTSAPTLNRIAAPTKKVQTPARDLEPPLTELKYYDDGTTKGPSAYYEWKSPERGLMPPKFDNDTDEAQSKRSVLEEGNFDGNNDFQSNEARRLGNGNSKRIQYKDLQKMFSIPEFEFPIEAEGRDGYENAEAVNSFQVKIPYKTGKTERYYYLEHAHCNPECHPYFFKPGRCEPCIKL